MPSHSVSVVVDKGTLDAITSGSSLQTGDSTAYLTELYRLLVPGGLLLLVTTMTPAVLTELMTSTHFDPALRQLTPRTETREVWRSDTHVAIAASTGPEVHYYSLQKKTTPARDPSRIQASDHSHVPSPDRRDGRSHIDVCVPSSRFNADVKFLAVQTSSRPS